MPYLNAIDAKRQARADFGWGARGRIADDQLDSYHARVAYYMGQDSFEGVAADSGPAQDSDSHLAAVALAGMGHAPLLLTLPAPHPPPTAEPPARKRHVSETHDPSMARAPAPPPPKRPALPPASSQPWAAPQSTEPQPQGNGMEPRPAQVQVQVQQSAARPRANGVAAGSRATADGGKRGASAQRVVPGPPHRHGGQPGQQQGGEQRAPAPHAPQEPPQHPHLPPPPPPPPPPQQQQQQQQQAPPVSAAAAAAGRAQTSSAPARPQQAKQRGGQQQQPPPLSLPLQQQQREQQQQQQHQAQRQPSQRRHQQHQQREQEVQHQQQQTQEQEVAVGSTLLMDVLTKLASANHHHAVQATIARAEVFIQRAVESGGDANLAMGLLAQMLQGSSDDPAAAPAAEPQPLIPASQPPPSPYGSNSSMDLNMGHGPPQGPSMPVPVVGIQGPGQQYRPTVVFTSASYGRGPPAPIPVIPGSLGQLVIGQVAPQSMLHG